MGTGLLLFLVVSDRDIPIRPLQHLAALEDGSNEYTGQLLFWKGVPVKLHLPG